MPMWRCPHCGTPQAETARCWVCRRSSTTCSTCRHFRRSVAAQLGYCGLDRRRLPLSGLELRGCWDAGPARATDAIAHAPVAAEEASEWSSPALRLREFVPVEVARRSAAPIRAVTQAGADELPEAVGTAAVLGPAPARLDPIGPMADRATLFMDAEL